MKIDMPVTDTASANKKACPSRQYLSGRDRGCGFYGLVTRRICDCHSRNRNMGNYEEEI